MSFRSVISEEDKTKISELFETMNDSPGKESDKLAKDWMKTHDNHFSGFVGNGWLPNEESTNAHVLSNFSEQFATVVLSSTDTMAAALASSHEGFASWISLSNEQHSLYLNKIAQNIEKCTELFAQVESLSSGKHLYKTRTKDVPNLIQSFFYYASLADFPRHSTGWEETGVVCVVAEEYNNPMLSVSWRVASILAGGNVVLLLADVKSCVSAFLLAELCHLSGLPSGVLNVLPIDQHTFDSLPGVEKLIFTGKHSRCKKYIEMATKHCIPCEVLISRRPVVIVYEDADLHSAVNGILETLFFNDTRTNKSGCKVFIQTSIQKKFQHLLTEKFAKIAAGMNLSKTDMSCVVTHEQRERLQLYVQEAKEQQLEIVEVSDIKDATYVHYKPTLICNMTTTSRLLNETLPGPIVVTVPFRTVLESITMFNHDKLGLDASVWTEKLTLGLEVAHKLKSRTVWLNSQNLFDPSVVYGGVGLSGSSIEGGKESFFTHLKVKGSKEVFSKGQTEAEINLYGSKSSADGVSLQNDPKVKLNCDLHIGGSYKKPSGGTSRIIVNAKAEPYAYVADGSSSDLQNAVSSAAAAHPKWQNLGKYKRFQILLKASETLKGKKDEFVSMLCDLTGEDSEACTKEVLESVSRLRFWASYATNCDGQLTETQVYGKVLQDRNSLGVIGIQSPDEKPLLSFVSLVIPAIVSGNTVVVIPSEKYPVPAFKMCEILQSSGILGGTVNIISGCRSNLTRHLCLNFNVDSIWFGVDGAAFIYNSCSIHPKKVFNYSAAWNDFTEATKHKLVLESTMLKTIYIPMGTIYC